jgi:predicted ATPase/transcriptional regulator with XRE-family HTH domain
LFIPFGHKIWYKKYDKLWQTDSNRGDMMEAHSFGSWLRLRRKALDLTRERLAGHVGCSAGTIQKLEEEERRPSAQMAERLAEIFNIPPNEQPAFVRFARGELQYGIPSAQEDSPWNSSAKLLPSNLPTMVTSLIGRKKEIAEVHNYLLSPDVRLVTLVGPPGIGKTRLSIEAARTALPDFANSVFFAALAPLDSPTLIAVTIAQAMGYVGAGNVSTVEQLKEGIGNKQLLIVLDNCEHLIEDVAALASALLYVCPRLKILASSRESLSVPGEWLYPVQALDVPALDNPGEDSAVDMDAVLNFPALTLFAERARAVRPNFAIDPDNVKAISAICKHLDGLPLAIELVAARMRLITPKALLEHLHDQFSLSAAEMRAVPARQKSLENAIDWSYQLLSEEEQKLFSYLSVFSGGFTLEAPETIFSQAFQDKTVSALIASLFDKSLLQRSFDPSGEVAMICWLRFRNLPGSVCKKQMREPRYGIGILLISSILPGRQIRHYGGQINPNGSNNLLQCMITYGSHWIGPLKQAKPKRRWKWRADCGGSGPSVQNLMKGANGWDACWRYAMHHYSPTYTPMYLHKWHIILISRSAPGKRDLLSSRDTRLRAHVTINRLVQMR